MAVGKKGVFYTLLSIVFILIFLFFIKVKTEPRLDDRSDLIKVRVDTMNEFLYSVEGDLQRYLYIAGFRSILAFNQQIINSNSSFSDIQAAFQESVFNGTVNNNPEVLLSDSTFYDWASSIQEKARELNIDLKFNNPELYVYHADPWHINLDLNVSISASDLSGLASWDYRNKVSSTISITGFEDPLYLIHTHGRYINIINKTFYENNYTSEVSPGVWDLTNLKDHLSKGYYSENSDAPDFLMRFEGKLTSSPYGIESLVNLDSLNSKGLPVYPYSVVDHMYWSSSSGRSIPGMQSWFSIDASHEEEYQVSAL